MALTTTIVEQTVFGNHRVVIADLTFDSSYPTNGEAVSLAALGLTSIQHATLTNKSGYIAEYDYAADKIIVRYPTASGTAPLVASQVANATDLSSLTVRILAIGK